MSETTTTTNNYNTLVNSLLHFFSTKKKIEEVYEQEITKSNLALARAIYLIKTSPEIPEEEKSYRAIAKKLQAIRYITYVEVGNLYNGYKKIAKLKKGGAR